MTEKCLICDEDATHERKSTGARYCAEHAAEEGDATEFRCLV